MDRIERTQRAESYRMFFDAYAKFRTDGTEAHWYECNGRNIEIAFSERGDWIWVELYCPEILRSLSDCFGMAAERNEKIISMLHWLIWEAEEPGVYSIETADSDQEYDQLRVILTDHYRRCYYVCDWKGEGEERFIIKIHGVQITVCFSPDDGCDINGSIDVKVRCLETGEQFNTVVLQEEDDPEEIIRAIQCMACDK